MNYIAGARRYALGLVLCVAGCSAGSGSSSSGTLSSGGASGSVGSVTGALDGTWDVTTYGKQSIAPSSISIAAGRIQGAIPTLNEGRAEGTDCTRSRERIEIDLNVQGASLTGKVTDLLDFEGTGCAARGLRRKETTIQVIGQRKFAAPASDTDMNGFWDIRITDATAASVISSNLSGLSGDVSVDTLPPTTGQFAIANGVLTASLGSKWAFAAKKR
ncbi:MAG: hypothetical protein HOO96_35915 [Polyangiaceae bacterium]|nr:hypothetical protein [Polyangiaceae bacterium]